MKLNVDFFAAREAKLLPDFGTLVYTGPIDSYFASAGLPKLEYRSLRFEEEVRSKTELFQRTSSNGLFPTEFR